MRSFPVKYFQTSVFSLLLLMISTTCIADTLKDFEKEMAALKGKVVYIDFWASWCVPCRQSFPWLNDIQQAYKDKNFTVLSVNLDADKHLATKFLSEIPATFPVFYDPKGKVARNFKLKGMPSSYLINKAGKMVSSHVGFNEIKQKKYQQEIEKLMTE